MRGIGFPQMRALRQALAASDFASLDAMLQQLESESRIVRKPYTYNAVFAAGVAPAGTLTVTVAIDASAPFLIVNQTYFAMLAAGTAQTAGTYVYPNMTVLLTDTGSGEQMSDVAVPVTSIFGNGQFPYVLPEPKLMDANSSLQVQVSSQEAANTNILRLSFNGYKLFQL